MAIKTLILRPITGSYDSPATYPDSVATEERYLLVSEEVADDDATYISINTTAINAVTMFSVPSGYQSLIPQSMRLVVRARAASTATTGLVVQRTHMSLDASSTSNVELASFAITSEYAMYTTTIESSIIEGVWNALYTDNASNYFILKSKASSGKNTALRVTQVYLEVDFEVEDTEATGIYVRNNGSFIEASKFFKMISGIWTEITVDECKSILQNNLIVRRSD